MRSIKAVIADIICPPQCPISLPLYYVGAGFSTAWMSCRCYVCHLVYYLPSLMQASLLDRPSLHLFWEALVICMPWSPTMLDLLLSLSCSALCVWAFYFYLCEPQLPYISKVVSSKMAHTFQGSCEDQITWGIFYQECAKCLI